MLISNLPRLDQACIFIGDAEPCYISGIFHVALPQSFWFKGIRVRLLESLKVYGLINDLVNCLLTMSGSNRNDCLIRSNHENITMVSETPIGSSKTFSSFQLPARTYQFPFTIHLTRRMSETVAGPGHMYHTYHVKAVVERRFTGNSEVSKPIRLYHDPLGNHHRISSTPTVCSALPP